MSLLLPPAPGLPGAPDRVGLGRGGFWDGLEGHGDRPALISAEEQLSFDELAARVRALRARLGTTRRLVLLPGANHIEAVVGYLACLADGHPVILVPGDHRGNLDAVVAAYDPDVVLDRGEVLERRSGSTHELHPDLALMLSTSGSTGSPKLVRLSAENVASNAAAIASYLGIGPDDVAITTLPMHYCYGLSVLTSHLAAGASVVLSDLSVVDPCFWDAVRRHRVTSFAGVPYTFDLLDRVGFADLDVPSLRYLTQAGGRLAPERVREYAALGRARGWDLYVMYGQTEATARMAYLPPDLAHTAPSAIGAPIPGGSFRLEPLPEAPLSHEAVGLEVGELVYEGPNVMLGYATSPSDLARGCEVHALHTGDVARRRADGLMEIIGRRSRFAKVFGLRVDLDQVEQVYVRAGHIVHCVDGGDRLLLAVETSAKSPNPRALTRIAKEQFALPPAAVDLLALGEVPRLPSGKADYRSIEARARERTATARRGGESAVRQEESGGRGAASVDARMVLGRVLGRHDITDADTFVSLGGDSLSYVEASLRLEAALGHLPVDWPTTPVGELAASGSAEIAGPPSRSRTLETNVALRALAIIAIVGSHANLFVAVGGAHVLLAVAGFNFGRFHVTSAPRGERVRHLAASAARVAVPSMAWLAVVAVATQDIGWRNVLLLNGALGPRSWTEPEWWYWFVEVLVWVLLAMTALLAVPWVDRIERRWPFLLPFALALAGLLTRYDVVQLVPGDEIHRGSVVFWLFALGWATVKSATTGQRILVSGVVMLSVPGFFGDLVRDAAVVAGMLLLVWLRAVQVPSWLARTCGVLAAASLYIYLAHWQIYPHLEERYPLAATLLSLAGGIALWQLVARLPLTVGRPGRSAPPRRAAQSPWRRCRSRRTRPGPAHSMS
ncbi:AMP-binding protein [soil metagenome]